MKNNLTELLVIYQMEKSFSEDELDKQQLFIEPTLLDECKYK